jgi:polar amino acid transport system substrate-binding protein
MFNLASATAGLLLMGMTLAASAQPVSADVRKEIAPTGTLRAAINYNNPLLAHRDPATGELSGVAVDVSRELARRLGVSVQLIPYDAAGKMADAAKSGSWDIAYLAIDPMRAMDLDFTAAYIELEGTYLVPPGSPLQKIEDVDRDGVRIAVTAKSAYDLFLSREIKHAQLVRANSTPESFDLMVSQKLDAVAAVRTALIPVAQRLPGSRVMSGHFMTIPQAAAIPKGRPAAARYVGDFIEDIKASGFVATALQRHGLGPDDAIVAAPAAAAALHVVTYFDVQPTVAAKAVAWAAQYVKAARAEAGNLAADAYQEIGRGGRLLVIETWKDQAAYDAHDKGSEALRFREQLKPFQYAPPDPRLTYGFDMDMHPGKADANTLYVVTHVDVPGPQREAAESLLKTLAGPTRKEAGRVRYDVLQQVDPHMNHFTVIAEWAGPSAFDGYGRAPASMAFRENIAPLQGALYDERLYRRIP